MPLLETILTTVALPAILDFLKGSGAAISRKAFGLSVDDQIKLETAQVGKLEALAKLDNPYGTPDQWVINLRASFRYIAAGVLIMAGIGIMAVGANQYLAATESPEAQELAKFIVGLGAETAGTPFFFIFGERMWQGIKGAFTK